MYRDLKRKATDNNLEIGEKVLVKKLYKLTTNFNPTTHIVTGVPSGDVNIRYDDTGKEYLFSNKKDPFLFEKIENTFFPIFLQ